MTTTDEGGGKTLRLISASKTDAGKQREQNEDACFDKVVEHGEQSFGLFIVADGMGGYKAGEVASQIAVETISAELLPILAPISDRKTMPLAKRAPGKSGRRGKGKSTLASAETGVAASTEAAPTEAATTRELIESIALEHYTNLLMAAVQAGSKAIVDYGNSHKDAYGLGSTVTAALIIDGQAFIANVGDSRTYLLRDGTLRRITQDHSLVERLVQAGQIERDEVYDHPHRNLVYRSLGANRAEAEVDIFVERVRPGDSLLLCCDGLWEMVRDPQLERILSDVADPSDVCDQLIQHANENGGEDNITAVVVRCLER